jgi:hypothetical protein
MDKLQEYNRLAHEPKRMVLCVKTKAEKVSTQQIDMIRPFLLRDFAEEDLYIREMMLANNQVDRASERFDDGYLARFAQTIVGKSVLIGHDHGSAPFGKFFDAAVTQDAAGWSWVAPWFYTPISAGNQLERDYIDAGVWSYVSIGASVDYKGLVCDICGLPYYYWLTEDETAAKCPHIAGEIYDGKVCTLTWDSAKSDMTLVEAVEGSIVYLGCQYEAAIAKSVQTDNKLKTIKREMVLESITPLSGKLEAVMEKTVEQLDAELSAKAVELTELATKCDVLQAKLIDLEPMAEIGKLLKADLQAEVVRLSQCLQMGDSYELALRHYSVDELKATRDDLEKQWAIKRPAQGKIDDETIDAAPVVLPKRETSII